MSYVNPSFDARQLRGIDLDPTAPSAGQVIQYNGGSGDYEAATLDASDINNDSGVAGADVAAALDTLASQITNPPLNVVSSATTRTMLAGEDVQLVTAGGQTISLAAIPASGTIVRVKRVGNGGGNTTIDTSDSATIDGSSSFTLGNNASATLLSDGTNWQVI